MDWASLPLVDAPLDRLVWPCHDLDPAHIHPSPAALLTQGPICVEELVEGSLFIHDGRHRAARARLRGDATIAARVLLREGTGCSSPESWSSLSSRP